MHQIITGAFIIFIMVCAESFLNYRNIKSDCAEYLKALSENHKITKSSAEFHEKANFFVNIIAASAVMGLYVLGKITFSDALLYAACLYILYDIFGIFIDKAVVSVYDWIFDIKLHRVVSHFKKSGSKERETLLKSLKEEKDDHPGLWKHIYPIEYEFLDQAVKECQKIVEEEKKNVKEEDDVYSEQGLDDLKRAKLYIDDPGWLLDNLPHALFNKGESVISAAEKLLKRAEIQPSVMSRINKAFNIYFPELQMLIYSYSQIDSETERKEKAEILSGIMEDLKNYMDEARESIKDEDRMQFDINSTLLKESIEKERKKTDKKV